MSIISGAEILASTWNAYVRSRAKTTIFSKSKNDKFLHDDSESGSGTFWVRSAGWNWPNFLAEHKTGETYIENEEVALYITPVATEYIIAVRCNNALGTTAAPDPAHADWDLYRYEFGYQNVVIGDEVVYGGGLFTALTNAGITAPLHPKYGDIANSDTNYTRSMASNCSTRVEGRGMISTLTMTLKLAGGGSGVQVYSRASTSEITDSLWLSPGQYDYTWDFDDTATTGFSASNIDLYVQQYDDNVKQWSELRVFASGLGDLAGKGDTQLLASAMNSTPLATDFDIDKKGGTASAYTGDW